MGLILNTHIKKLMKGYPTVSDKYNVSGGVLGGEKSIEVGTVLALTSADGVFEPATAETEVSKIAGVALAPNVKLTDIWSGDRRTLVHPGEAVNLCFEGLFAVEVEAEEAAKIIPGAKVGWAEGKLVVFEEPAEGEEATSVAIPGWFFTGCTEGVLAEVSIVR